MTYHEMDETLLKEYFNQDMVVPSSLVQNTILEIKKRDNCSLSIIMTACSCSIVLIGIVICLLMAPIPLLCKLGLFVTYCFTQGIAAVWVVHRSTYVQDGLSL